MNLAQAIARITGLVWCGRDCPCGRKQHLWYTDVKTPDDWLSYNGIPTEEIVEAIKVKLSVAHQAFESGVREGRAAQAIEELRGRDKFIEDCKAKGIGL
ncbi:MAG: hypothetical protein ACLQLG_08870 [Thermoguttaceae bacterium]